jgi:uncharacterized membrane protein YebE (DUF533 family)
MCLINRSSIVHSVADSKPCELFAEVLHKYACGFKLAVGGKNCVQRRNPAMFDAKNLLDALMRSSTQPRGQQGGFGALEDLLGQLVRTGQNSQTSDSHGGMQRDQAQRGEDHRDERADTLPGPTIRGERQNAAPDEPTSSGSRRTLPDQDVAAGQKGSSGQQSAGGLEEMLRNALGGQAESLSDILTKLQQQGGGLAGILGQVLGEATSGVKEGAGRIDDATGASRYARDAVGQATGRTPEELMAQLKELIASNQLATGTALGGLGALVLGTATGRSLAGSAIKLGSLALIGGLAYKAYQNYQHGQPVLTGAKPQQQALLAAPEGSGFEPDAVTHEKASLLIRAMIAAAAADGRIDEKEQEKILGGLKQADLGGAAQQFLTREIKNPATVDDLANAVSSPEESVQVYTAARIAVDPDIEEEHQFLIALANRLGIDKNLAAHIDAAARSAGT